MTYSSRKTLRNFLAIALAAAFLCAGLSARAQEVTGSISGFVTDASGAVVKGANVVVTNTAHNQVIRTVTTNTKGFYAANSLPVATYSVTITAPAFSTLVVNDVVVHSNAGRILNRKLHAGSATDSVITTASDLHVNLGNANVQDTTTGMQARELPLATRNFEQVLTLQPGVTYGGTVDQSNIGQSVASRQTNIAAYSIDGQRSSGNYWTIDGADNMDHGANQTLINYPSVEAIAEVKTLRGNYSAASGRTLGSQINVITRSGTNDLHGSIYEFFRNDAMNANNYFNKEAGVARPELRYNDFGGTIGGAIPWSTHYIGRDKTFFFISEEVRRIVSGASTQVLEPLPSELGIGGTIGTGHFANTVCTSVNPNTGACNGPTGTTVVANSATAVNYIRDIFSRMPAPNPNAVAGQDPHNLTYNARNVYNNEQEFIRLDHKINSRASIYYRYIRDSLPTQEGNGFLNTTGSLPGVDSTATNSPSTGHLVHLTYAISPRSIFDFGYAYTAGSNHTTPIGLTASINSPDIQPVLPYQTAAAPTGVVPVLNFQGGTSIASVGNYNNSSKNHNLFGTYTRTWHQHTLSIGATVNHYEKTETEPNGYPLAASGNYNFNGENAPGAQGPAGPNSAVNLQQSIANFLLGVANGGFTEPSIAPIADLGELQEEAFLQDNWKVSPRLTVNVGVHYSHFLQPVDNNGRLSSFLPGTFIPGNVTGSVPLGDAPVIDTTGTICTSLELASFPAAGGSTATCPNSTSRPNSNYDPFNGMIFSNDILNTGHTSPWYDQVAHTDKLDFAPRVGFAYDVFGDGHTTLRGGYGIYYDNIGVGMFENAIFNNVPFVITAQAPVASVDNPAASTAPWAPQTAVSSASGVFATASPYGFMPPTLYAAPARFHSPYSQQYSISLQHQFPHELLVDIAAVGSHDTHLLGREDINQVKPGLAATDSANAATPTAQPTNGYTTAYQEMPLNQIRPFVGYGPINAYESSFNSNYSSLQVHVQKKFNHDSLIEANYTLARNMTNALGDNSTAQNSYYLVPEYGRSQFDRKHVLGVDGVYGLPFYSEQQGLVGHALGGWEVSGILSLASGMPLTVTTTGVDPAGLGLLSIGTTAVGRPNQIGNPNIASPGGQGIHNHAQWFNTSAFALAPVCAANAAVCFPGNEHPSSVNGPGIARLDMGLFRNFKIEERVNFQFRAEAYNLLNNTNWATVSTNGSATNFGQPTSARDPRTLQIALKLGF